MGDTKLTKATRRIVKSHEFKFVLGRAYGDGGDGGTDGEPKHGRLGRCWDWLSSLLEENVEIRRIRSLLWWLWTCRTYGALRPNGPLLWSDDALLRLTNKEVHG